MSTDISADILKAIDKAVEAAREDERRRHLGASVLGRRCMREVYYGFRWFYSVQHTGRMLRLFDRGQKEEARFIGFLKSIGFEVRERAQMLMYNAQADAYAVREWDWLGDPSDRFDFGLEEVTSDPIHITRAEARGIKVKQWRVSAHNGHLGGSMDGKVLPPDIFRIGPMAEGRGLVEFKTHGSKSFAILKSKGLQSAKLEHYIQMQVYMEKGGLDWGIYLAVNKDTDELHCEIVQRREEIAGTYIARAGQVINAVEVPERITTNPSWFECKFCDYREICHHGKAPAKNCRTCVFSRPSMDPEHPGEWHCGLFNGSLIPDAFMRQGCDKWNPIE